MGAQAQRERRKKMAYCWIIQKEVDYDDECRGINFAGVAIFQDEEERLVYPFCLEYSYETDDSKHFSDEIVGNDFAYFKVKNYERSCRNVKEVLKRREWKHLWTTVYFLVLWYISVRYKPIYECVTLE